MTTATQNLENDHVQILRLIEVMERITQSDNPNVEHMETLVKVIREFADGLHHAKEEQFLFPLMVQKGFSNETGPVAVMLHDHVEGRNFVKGMAEKISLYKQGETTALKAIYKNMLGYADLLKNHIGKENNVLFRMADNAFTTAEQQSLLLDFTKVENERENGQSKNDYVLMIDNLAGIYVI
ncbi:MAG: hemerythrin hhe cation binding domain protein [Bacteroidetes bacterium]|nr:MAG: hemerythrin hhe cation binding domain protein [Bacteroidota bacterium]